MANSNNPRRGRKGANVNPFTISKGIAKPKEAPALLNPFSEEYAFEKALQKRGTTAEALLLQATHNKNDTLLLNRFGTNSEQRDSQQEKDRNETQNNEMVKNEDVMDRKRKKQEVSDFASRLKVMKWMQEMESKTVQQIPSKAVLQFPEMFSGNRNSNLQKASTWFKKKDAILLKMQAGELRMGDPTAPRSKRARMKTLPGRGKKLPPHAEYWGSELFDEITRLRSLNYAINIEVITSVLKVMVGQSDHPEFNMNFVYNGKSIVDLVCNRDFIRRFIERYNFNNSITESSKKKSSLQREISKRKLTAFDLGRKKIMFSSPKVQDDQVSKIEETHIMLDFSNPDSTEILDANAAQIAGMTYPGIENITVVLQLRGGEDSRIELAEVIFKSDKSTYPVRGLIDPKSQKDDAGQEYIFAYRTSPNGWLTAEKFKEYFSLLKKRPDSGAQYLFSKNYVGQGFKESLGEVHQTLKETNHFLCFSEGFYTNLDSSPHTQLIAEFRAHWNFLMNEVRPKLTMNGEYTKDGMFIVKGKKKILEMVAECVNHINGFENLTGSPLCRNCFIQCGLGRGINGEWTIEQLTQVLQEIILSNNEEFQLGVRYQHLLENRNLFCSESTLRTDATTLNEDIYNEISNGLLLI